MYHNVYVHAGLIIVEMKTFLPLFYPPFHSPWNVWNEIFRSCEGEWWLSCYVNSYQYIFLMKLEESSKEGVINIFHILIAISISIALLYRCIVQYLLTSEIDFGSIKCGAKKIIFSSLPCVYKSFLPFYLFVSWRYTSMMYWFADEAFLRKGSDLLSAVKVVL